MNSAIAPTPAMVLLEEYFELHEAENITKFWKCVQIVSYICAAGFGIWCGFTIALLRIAFGNRCFLFAKIVHEPELENGEPQIRFEDTEHTYDESVWSRDSTCEYCQYSMVSSFIFSTIWATFFLMCGKGGKSSAGLPKPWRIVVPAMIFNFLYFLISFVAAEQIQQGTDVFCEKRLGDLSSADPFPKCSVLRYFNKSHAHDLLIRIEIAIKTSWITAISWFFAFLIPLIRILFVSDFNLYKVCVYKMDDLVNHKEEILKVTEYEDVKHVHFAFTTQPHEKHLHHE